MIYARIDTGERQYVKPRYGSRMADTPMDSLDELAELLAQSETLPVLFIGSGFSRRYLGSPDWEGLLEYAASLTSYPLDYYSGQLPTDTPKDLRLPKIATLIAREFHQVWWKDPAYADLRSEYAGQTPDGGDPLKAMLARHIESMELLTDEKLRDELERLRAVKAHAIVTTNYDTLLEDTFDDFEVYVGQQDVLFASPQYVGEIYKIHGSTSEPRSLVLTGDDYDVFRARNPYLTAKMMTLFAEHPVVFFGYSLRDPHITDLLGTLVSCLSQQQLETFNQRLIFVGRVSTARKKGLSTSSITVPGFTFAVQEFGVEDFEGVYGVLADLPEYFPVKLLRSLSQRVTQMAYSAASDQRIHVLPLQEGEDVTDVDVVVGVGAFERLGERGYTVYSRAELFLDMIACSEDHNMDNLVAHLRTSAFRNAKFSPIFYPKYLADLHGIDFNEELLPTRARDLLNGKTSLEPYPGRRPANWEQMGFAELLAEHPELATNLATGCSYTADDVIALGGFLWPQLQGNKTPSTPLAKAGAKFDRLVYGNDFDGDADALRERVRRELGKPRY